MEQMTLDSAKNGTKEDTNMASVTMKFTGDPFVDMGGLVMETLPQKRVPDKIRFATDVYVDQWKGKIHSVFLHSKITHIKATGKPEQQRANSLAYYMGLLKNEGIITNGYCRICTHEGPLFSGERTNYPLVGSGEFVNFHHFHEEGLLLCKACLIKLYFLPLGIVECGDKLMALQLDDDDTRELWQEDYIQENLDKIARGTSQGMLKSSLMNPQNALFYIAGRLIEKFSDLLEKPPKAIRLVYFSNFGSKADMAFHDLPNEIFSFLKRVCQPDLKTDWRFFVKKHYRIRKATFDEEKGEWIGKKKKETFQLDVNEYSGKNRNTIYERLLSGKTITGYLCREHKKRSFPIMIAITYLREVRKMRQEQIDLIRDIADKVIGLAQKEENFKKYITPIEGAKYASHLRTVILRCVKAHYVNGGTEPFVRLNDYLENLFPDGQYWSEVRDLLLICLYEKLHELRIEPSQLSASDIAEPETDALDAFNQ